MARIREWMDLSELGDTASLTAAGWLLVGQVTVVNSPFHDVQGNGGTYSLRVNPGSFITVTRARPPVLASPISTFRIRAHLLVDGYDNQGYVFTWWKGGNFLGGIKFESASHHIQLYSGGTLLAESTNQIFPNQWYTVEVGITIGNSGTYEVRVNGSSVGWIPSASGDTQPGSDTNVDTLTCLYYDIFNQPPGINIYFDDLAVDDGNWCGEGFITALHPNGAGNTTELTPSSGANWQNVDEIPPSDADYNETTVPNKKDTYTHTALPSNTTSVKAALIAARVVKVGSTINNGYIVLRSGVTDFESAAQLLSLSPAIVTKLWETDPNDGVWTPTSLNASQIGIRFDT